MTLEEQLEALAEAQGGTLTDEQMADALTGKLSEDDIAAALAAAEKPGASDAGAVKDPPKDEPASEAQEPKGETTPKDEPDDGKPKVILAKDGVHTIGYEKLVEAREAAAAAKAEADALRAQLAAAKASPAPAAPAEPAAVDPPAAVTFGNYDDKDLATGIQALIDRSLAVAKVEWDKNLTPLQAQLAEANQRAHLTSIYTAHPDAESIVMSKEFEAWKASQPSFVRASFEAIQDKGSASQMVELLSAYRQAHPANAPAPVPAKGGKTVEQRADDAIKNAQERTPNSLSDLPAGTQAHHDEGEAMAEMDSVDLMNFFGNKSPKQIEALMNRTL